MQRLPLTPRDGGRGCPGGRPHFRKPVGNGLHRWPIRVGQGSECPRNGGPWLAGDPWEICGDTNVHLTGHAHLPPSQGGTAWRTGWEQCGGVGDVVPTERGETDVHVHCQTGNAEFPVPDLGVRHFNSSYQVDRSTPVFPLQCLWIAFDR